MKVTAVGGLILAVTLAAVTVSAGVKLGRHILRARRERAAWREITRSEPDLRLALRVAWLEEQIDIRARALRRHLEGGEDR